jgi:hypothetical protein
MKSLNSRLLIAIDIILTLSQNRKMDLPEASNESPLPHGRSDEKETTPSTQFEGTQRLLMFTESPVPDEDIGKIHAIVKEKLELANDDNV